MSTEYARLSRGVFPPLLRIRCGAGMRGEEVRRVELCDLLIVDSVRV